MSKFAALGLAHGLRHSGWDLGIRATAICPGFVATDMARSLSPREDWHHGLNVPNRTTGPGHGLYPSGHDKGVGFAAGFQSSKTLSTQK